MGCPPSLGILSEVIVGRTVIGMGGLLGLVPLVVLLFFGGAYNLYLYSETQHGTTLEGVFRRKYRVLDYTRLLGFLFWGVILIVKGEFIVG